MIKEKTIPKRKIIFILGGIVSMFIGVGSFSAAKAATCSATASDGVCNGISNSAVCSNALLTDCSFYPRCSYSGAIQNYYCNNNCFNSGQSAGCGTGQVCLCVNQNVCGLCGANSSACSDVGCGGSDSINPTVAIATPTSNTTYTTTVSPMALSGTAADNVTVSEIAWSNNRNNGFVRGSGIATGTTAWSVDYINLESGQNVITLNARDGLGNIGTDTITVTYNPPSSPSHSSISVAETSSNYNIAISASNSLTDVAYAWGVKPHIYFIIPFASNSAPSLSATEQARYSSLIANFPAAWDSLTGSKHPLKFYFMAPFVVSNYTTSENSKISYATKAISKFETDNAQILNYPAIYVIMYPEPYFSGTTISMFGDTQKHVLANVFFDMFNDTKTTDVTSPNEIISNVLLHELTHNFAPLPNDINFPPGTTRYFWQGHPAGFVGTGGTCDNTVDLTDCPPYGTAQSPTGTEGYYEAYSILSIKRALLSKANFGLRDPELSPLVEMAMGIRSRYEDANYIYYAGDITYVGNEGRFNLVAAHDYGISSRWLFDYDSIPSAPNALYWNIRYDSPKTNLASSSRSFSVAKSGQSSRPLIVYAGDAQNPGYFKVFSNNAQSEVVSYTGTDITSPGAPSGLSVQ